MSSRLKLTGIALAAAFALAACGGGGGGTAGTTPPPTDPRDDRIAELERKNEELQNEKDQLAEDEQKREREAMVATAAKLHTGISAPGGTSESTRTAAYNTAETHIAVTIGTDTPVELAEDKKTMAGDNRGWAGKRYANNPAPGQPSFEAMVYSNVGMPTQGMKFSELDGFADGVLPSANFAAANVAMPRVTRTSGTETFDLPDPNPDGVTIVNIPGSYYGVPGTYSCTPGDGGTCTATVAERGLTVGGAGSPTWTFRPSNADARVTEMADMAYASYGWWIRKDANDGPVTVSAFHDFKGTAGTVEISDLRGTATYRGGAAGKYALTSTTGGTNDAGHFNADVTLNAKFGTAHTITGTVDNFRGADDEMRHWSVDLKEATLGADGAISRAAEGDTVWTIGDQAASASGAWMGNLREEGDDGVPKAASGTFYTEYGTAGKMVGAFGANKQ